MLSLVMATQEEQERDLPVESIAAYRRKTEARVRDGAVRSALQYEPITLADDRDPWERQPRESRIAYEAFTRYRDQDPVKSGRAGRSGKQVAESLGRSKTLIHRWQSRFRWVDRVYEWDRHVDALVIAKREQDKLDTYDRQVAVGRGIMALIIQWIPTVDPTALTAREISALAKVASELELRGVGEPTAHVQHTGIGGAPLVPKLEIVMEHTKLGIKLRDLGLLTEGGDVAEDVIDGEIVEGVIVRIRRRLCNIWRALRDDPLLVDLGIKNGELNEKIDEFAQRLRYAADSDAEYGDASTPTEMMKFRVHVVRIWR